MKEVKVLMAGDVSGSSGMRALFIGLSQLVKKHSLDFVIVNGENASDGFGISQDNYYDFKKYGVDVITSGNHIWQKDEIFSLLDSKVDLLRPLNYPKSVIGHGYCTIEKKGIKYSVVNLQGRTNMPLTDCPFAAGIEICKKLSKISDLVFVDFHAESTNEKEALGFYLDGIANVVVGTHTHVQTMDEKILPKGCAYLTDLGLTGVQNKVIGSKPEISIQRQLTNVSYKTEVAEGESVIKGLIITFDKDSKKVISLQRI